jgi:hypothetical protein
MITVLFLLLAPAAFGQAASSVPSDWKVVKDSKGACQISVPPGWAPLSESSGAAVLNDATNAIAVVTSQPGQAFKPMAPAMIKLIEIRKEKMFENTATRIFYQDKTAANADDTNAYTSSVPGNGGTCSCRVVFVPKIGEELAKKITLSLAPIHEAPPQ